MSAALTGICHLTGLPTYFNSKDQIRNPVPYILVVLQEHVEVAVFTEDRVRGQPLQEDLMGGHGLLKDSKVLPAKTHGTRWHAPSSPTMGLLCCHGGNRTTVTVAQHPDPAWESSRVLKTEGPSVEE